MKYPRKFLKKIETARMERRPACPKKVMRAELGKNREAFF